MTDTNPGPVLPRMQIALFDEQGNGADDRVLDYGLQCWNACDEHVAGPLRERVAELEAQNAALERLCDEKYCATGADAYYHCCDQTEAWDADRLKNGLAPIYGLGEGRSLCGWIESIRKLLDNAESELNRLRSENQRLTEDRARFPDRPDDVGNMIGAHIENLKAKAKAAEEEHDRVQLSLHGLRAENEALRARINRAEVSYGNMLRADDKRPNGDTDYTRGWGDCLRVITARKGEGSEG